MHPIIQKYFKEHNVNAMLISDLLNVRYFSGFTGSTAMLLMTSKQNFFFSDFRYMTQAQKQVKGFKIVEVARESARSIATELEKLKLKKMLIEAGALTYSQYLSLKKGLPGVTLVAVTRDPAYFRMVKEKSGIKKIKKALHVNKLAFDKMIPLIKPGLREQELAYELEAAIRQSGGEKLSFDTIIASGPRGAMPHGIASSKKIRVGEFITIDFGCVVDGYCSDETCTVSFGKVSREQRNIYTIVKDAHDFAVEKIRPGMKGKEIDRIAREHISAKGFGKYFGHSLGHGIGLAVHERPMISHMSEDIVAENMVFSIEPGIYLPKWGGVRIENLVECTPQGGSVLSEIDKNLRVIDA